MRYLRHRVGPAAARVGFLPLLVLLACLLASCVIPVMQEEPFKPEVVQPIKVGKSTRDDVLFALGEPHTVNDDQSLFGYTSTQLHAVLVIGYAYSADFIPLASRHNLVVAFSKDGTVEKVEQFKGPLEGYCASENKCFPVSEARRSQSLLAVRTRWKDTLARREEARGSTRERLLPKARAGDASAQFAMAENAKTQAERWHWLCLAAHGGHSRSRQFMGARYSAGLPEPADRDPVTAYIWYGLAARDGDAQAEEALKQLRGTMSDREIARAERGLANWHPGPAECEQGKPPK